jgi:hypothetical protein
VRLLSSTCSATYYHPTSGAVLIRVVLPTRTGTSPKSARSSADRTFESCNMQVNQAFQFQGALACIFLRLRDLCSVP